jgi:hypothetical protein
MKRKNMKKAVLLAIPRSRRSLDFPLAAKASITRTKRPIHYGWAFAFSRLALQTLFRKTG